MESADVSWTDTSAGAAIANVECKTQIVLQFAIYVRVKCNKCYLKHFYYRYRFHEQGLWNYTQSWGRCCGGLCCVRFLYHACFLYCAWSNNSYYFWVIYCSVSLLVMFMSYLHTVYLSWGLHLSLDIIIVTCVSKCLFCCWLICADMMFSDISVRTSQPVILNRCPVFTETM